MVRTPLSGEKSTNSVFLQETKSENTLLSTHAAAAKTFSTDSQQKATHNHDGYPRAQTENQNDAQQ